MRRPSKCDWWKRSNEQAIQCLHTHSVGHLSVAARASESMIISCLSPKKQGAVVAEDGTIREPNELPYTLPQPFLVISSSISLGIAFVNRKGA